MIHVIRNPCDLASIYFILLDVEVRQRDSLFETSLPAINLDQTTERNAAIDSGISNVLDSSQSQPQPPVVQNSHE